MKLLLFLFLVFSFSNFCKAGNDYEQLVQGFLTEAGNSLVQASDGAFVIAGSTTTFGGGNTDFYVVKIDSSIKWTKTFGGTGDDVALCIAKTSDGGYVVTGYSASFGAGNYDMLVIKLDGAGVIQWSKTIGGSAYEAAYSVIQTSDGGYAICGATRSFGAGNDDIYVVKLNSSGNLDWSKTIGGPGNDDATNLTEAGDGGIVVAGITYSYGAGDADIYVVKLNSSGNLVWNKTIGGTGLDAASSIKSTIDGGFVIGGYTKSFGLSEYDCYILKMDGSGNLNWSSIIGGSGADQVWSVIQTNDGNYVAAGSTYSFPTLGSISDHYLIKLGSNGSLIWNRTIGGSLDDVANSVIQSRDGKYVITGGSKSFGAQNYDVFLSKMNSDGFICANSTNPSSTVTSNAIVGISSPSIASGAPTINTLSSVTISSGGTANLICFTPPTIGIHGNPNEIPDKYNLSQNYPNPFNPVTNIQYDIPENNFVTIKIYDVLGNEVSVLVNEFKQAGSYVISFDAHKIGSGIYFYKIETDEFVETKRMVLIK